MSAKKNNLLEPIDEDVDINVDAENRPLSKS